MRHSSRSNPAPGGRAAKPDAAGTPDARRRALAAALGAALGAALARAGASVLALGGARAAAATGTSPGASPGASTGAGDRARPPAVAAASDLQFALAEIAANFEAATGDAVKLTFGSSGNFAHQIARGAPFELFLSADEQYVFRLADDGHVTDRGAPYATGRIALFAPRASLLAVDARLEGLRAALDARAIRRFAIANPEHAPYGRAARAVLRHAGLWERVEPLLVLGENAAQAAHFAASGASQGGIVPLSLARSPALAGRGRFAALPAAWHAQEPLRQRVVLTRRAGSVARRFFDYLLQPEARAVLARHGLEPPGPASPGSTSSGPQSPGRDAPAAQAR